MGQKVHPLGFRVGITKKHQTQWFARFNKYAYSQSVVEDHLLRKTLMNLLPDLLNPVVKKAQKRDAANQESSITPKITQIKIERGLIPYEIGIQIHAENCELIKSLIDNLKINRELLNNLQKTRQYLSRVTSPTVSKTDSLLTTQSSDAGFNSKDSNQKANALVNESQQSDKQNTSEQTKKQISFKKALGLKRIFNAKNSKKNTRGLFSSRGTGLTNKQGLKNGKKPWSNSKELNSSAFSPASRSGKKYTKLSKAFFLKLKTIKKRLKKRQNIRNRYLQLLSKGLLIRKTTNFKNNKTSTKIVRKVSLKGFVKKLKSTKYQGFKVFGKTKNTKKINTSNQKVNNMSKTLGIKPYLKADSYLANGVAVGLNQTGKTPIVQKLSNKLSKKFASLFVSKLNKKFLVTVKTLMRSSRIAATQQQNQTSSNKVASQAPFRTAPLGFNKKWNITKLKNLKNQPLSKLTKLVDILEKKSLQKMESLRKDFFTFGTISKARSFGYYQLITFLKNLKDLVNKLKKQNKNSLVTKDNNSSWLKPTKLFKTNIKKSAVTQNVFNTIVNNLDNECRKIKLINYLQTLVQTHRNNNIFYYLSSMDVANQNLKDLKRYTKKHSSFLFGLDMASFAKDANSTQALQDKIEKVLVQSSKKQDLGLQPNLQETFLEQIENQRKMYKANLALTPKISIKFFSVKTDNVLEKASVVADSIVDALEKRKAFRGVIKKAQEDLMRRSRVKGVKIQVAGRLNGAEIARSEWVRAGRVPLQTLRANIDYSYRTASTIYGIIGVKVWIFKGYV
jgi:ribosomal protein S3